MENDLKSLQSKILDLENKLQFTHSVLEEDDCVNIQHKNVKFDPATLSYLNDRKPVHKQIKPSSENKEEQKLLVKTNPAAVSR